MSAQHTARQLQLFPTDPDVEQRVLAILSRRRALNVSGQAGEDIDQIRAALRSEPTGEQS